MGADKLKDLLERRQALAEEIARHPRPITGCDVHFNRLLEERAALSEEIARLEPLEDRGDALPAADAHGH
jgi:chorismate mutase